MAEDSIGALWKKTGQKGEYMTGEVEVNGVKQRIVVFKNSYKEKENQPDYRILASKPQGDKPQPKQEEKDFDEDIPF